MSIRLENTDAHEINEALFRLRKEGYASSGQVMTLLIDTPAAGYQQAMAEAKQAGLLHPCRILVAIRGLDDAEGLNAEVHTASATTEVITLKFHGEVDEHAESVLLPLLLPELPVVCWFPTQVPRPLDNPLTDRLIVDSRGAPEPIATVRRLAAQHRPGTTDLAWTRLTRWRALLVAALDQVQAPVTSARVLGPVDSSPGLLLTSWLELRLGVPVGFDDFDAHHPGLHAVVLETEAGEVRLERVSATDAVLSLPGQPDRPVALARRTTQQLLTEELSRLNGDASFDAIMGHLANKAAR